MKEELAKLQTPEEQALMKQSLKDLQNGYKESLRTSTALMNSLAKDQQKWKKKLDDLEKEPLLVTQTQRFQHWLAQLLQSPTGGGATDRPSPMTTLQNLQRQMPDLMSLLNLFLNQAVEIEKRLRQIRLQIANILSKGQRPDASLEDQAQWFEKQLKLRQEIQQLLLDGGQLLTQLSDKWYQQTIQTIRPIQAQLNQSKQSLADLLLQSEGDSAMLEDQRDTATEALKDVQKLMESLAKQQKPMRTRGKLQSTVSLFLKIQEDLEKIEEEMVRLMGLLDQKHFESDRKTFDLNVSKFNAVQGKVIVLRLKFANEQNKNKKLQEDYEKFFGETADSDVTPQEIATYNENFRKFKAESEATQAKAVKTQQDANQQLIVSGQTSQSLRQATTQLSDKVELLDQQFKILKDRVEQLRAKWLQYAPNT
ncbi:hypothetical protein A3H22_04300 [Candidatus Peribacteria bacterium RIFCSPLOWO2_12_FULL_55_15]|nr:MAG: hypothetical protein A3D12_01760 [Candidatus Peribacteria bacterium RIFCSPHIGHO2_02_FULL_55_24]OGJ64310.1 MAG: hypothetical protein A3E47_03110 [Candidatus Peribacteria bacterium RIFCSPHIGHO2_12_FULL_54_10]OGJ71243.1 MAG: hypothetical protein A3H22_04300 [Candidatus Peribacteria bacterium RIFCSPLOWO2_12_FULL_55_15]